MGLPAANYDEFVKQRLLELGPRNGPRAEVQRDPIDSGALRLQMARVERELELRRREAATLERQRVVAFAAARSVALPQRMAAARAAQSAQSAAILRPLPSLPLRSQTPPPDVSAGSPPVRTSAGGDALLVAATDKRKQSPRQEVLLATSATPPASRASVLAALSEDAPSSKNSRAAARLQAAARGAHARGALRTRKGRSLAQEVRDVQQLLHDLTHKSDEADRTLARQLAHQLARQQAELCAYCTTGRLVVYSERAARAPQPARASALARTPRPPRSMSLTGGGGVPPAGACNPPAITASSGSLRGQRPIAAGGQLPADAPSRDIADAGVRSMRAGVELRAEASRASHPATAKVARADERAEGEPTGGRQPVASPQRKATGGQQPITSPQRKATGGQQPITSPQRKPSGGQQPITSPQRKPTGGQQPASSPQLKARAQPAPAEPAEPAADEPGADGDGSALDGPRHKFLKRRSANLPMQPGKLDWSSVRSRTHCQASAASAAGESADGGGRAADAGACAARPSTAAAAAPQQPRQPLARPATAAARKRQPPAPGSSAAAAANGGLVRKSNALAPTASDASSGAQPKGGRAQGAAVARTALGAELARSTPGPTNLAPDAGASAAQPPITARAAAVPSIRLPSSPIDSLPPPRLGEPSPLSGGEKWRAWEPSIPALASYSVATSPRTHRESAPPSLSNSRRSVSRRSSIPASGSEFASDSLTAAELQHWCGILVANVEHDMMETEQLRDEQAIKLVGGYPSLVPRIELNSRFWLYDDGYDDVDFGPD